ncbi:MAG: SRPBCC family protein [Granulosicoccus sp.]|nr:SRPBCC family protein [Granulosicoccus sp.]
MRIEYKISINCPEQRIFDIYKDVSSWAIWDPDIEAAHLDGDFLIGASGWIKPKGAPKTPTQIVSMTEPRHFTVESKLPLCTMSFDHTLEPLEGNTLVCHAVEFNGFLAPLFSRLVGRKIRQGIEGTMQGLKEYAEQHNGQKPASVN